MKSRQLYRLLLAPLALALAAVGMVVPTSRGFAAEVRLSPPGILFLTGPIHAADVGAVAETLPKLFRNELSQTVTVVVDSSGGDVLAAMRVGRLLRRAEAHVSTCNCSSACVLILASAVSRSNCAGQAKIGVHRLYATVMSPDKPTEQIRSERRMVLKQLRDYLAEMSVPEALVDLMEGVPPEEMRYLTEQEQQHYGLVGDDPAWNEKHVARQAAFYGLTSAELRRRDALASRLCVYRGGDQLPPAFFYQNCQNMIRWGLTEAQFKVRAQRARDSCGVLESAANRDCIVRVMQADSK